MQYRPKQLWCVGLESFLRRIGYALPPKGLQAGADWVRLPVHEVLSALDVWWCTGFAEAPNDPRTAPSGTVSLVLMSIGLPPSLWVRATAVGVRSRSLGMLPTRQASLPNTSGWSQLSGWGLTPLGLLLVGGPGTPENKGYVSFVVRVSSEKENPPSPRTAAADPLESLRPETDGQDSV